MLTICQAKADVGHLVGTGAGRGADFDVFVGVAVADNLRDGIRV